MIRLDEHYDRDTFVTYLKQDFLSDFDKDIRPVKVSDNTTFDAAWSLGRSSILGLRVFEFNYSGSIKKRVSLTRDAFSLMREYATYQALAVFRSSETDDWRLSLLTATPQSNQRGQAELVFSNPKRYSYHLGPQAKVNTPIKFLITKGKVSDFDDLKSRFSLEVVNKEFYQEIAVLFNKLAGGTRGKDKKKVTYPSLLRLPDTPEDSPRLHEFAVRLIGRIIFCWFLREKRSDQGISLMPADLLSLAALEEKQDYYHTVLEPIFFEILNRRNEERKPKYQEAPYNLIPYLNGGLFTPQDDDYFDYDEGKQAVNHNTLKVPDEWLVKLFKVLELYNFTIDENTSYDEELSIDPEMLGRIFENLLAEINPETGESARKSTGSYYTPRVIVDYMIDESLLLYLKQKTGIDENKLRAVISFDVEEDHQSPLAEAEKQQVVNALETVTILDPACGSGAFPMGALQKIVFILQQIDPDGKYWFEKQLARTSPELRKVIQREFEHKNFDYIRKLGIIRANIYGVDIQPIATEISRLRCFLTLVVDQSIDDNAPDGNRGVQQLPNLDFKFVTANSLIGAPKFGEKKQTELFDNTATIDELKAYRDQYFTAYGEEREASIRGFKQVQKRLAQELLTKYTDMDKDRIDFSQKLANWNPFSHKPASWFDPEWMFGIEGGFDVVIANPPYISFGLRDTGTMAKNEKQILISLYPDSAEYKISIYAIFMDKAIQLSKRTGGLQTYIIPDSFLLGRYFSKVRNKILSNCEIESFAWFPYKIFDATVGYSVVYTFKNVEVIDSNHQISARQIANNNELAEKTYVAYSYEQSYFRSQKHNRFRLFFNDETKKLIDKIEDGSVVIGDYFIGRTGVRSKIGQDSIKSKTPSGDSWKRAITSGASVTKYMVVYAGDYLNIQPELLYSGGWDFDVINNPKILIRQTGDSLTAALDIERLYHLNNVHSFAPKEKSTTLSLKYLLGLLNSRLLNWFYHITSLEVGRAMAQTDIETLECIPIKYISQSEQQPFVDLVDQIINLKQAEANVGTTDKEKQIDQLVYRLYGLTEQEIAVVEGKND